MSWYQIYDAAFFLALSTILVGLLALCLKFAYRSRCTHIHCCCIDIVRDVKTEEELEMKSSPSTKSDEEEKQRI
jgi:hypothetical protein